MDLEAYIKATLKPGQKLMQRYAEVAKLVGSSTIYLHNIARRHKLPGTKLAKKIVENCPGITFEELIGSINQKRMPDGGVNDPTQEEHR